MTTRNQPLIQLRWAILSVVVGLFLLGWGSLLSTYFFYSEKRPDDFVLSEETPISIGHGIVGAHSISSEPVDILSYGTHFRIPRNYINTILHNKRDRTVDFTLETLYPDFMGVRNEEEIRTKFGTQNARTSINLIKIDSVYMPFSPQNDPNTVVFDAEANQPDHPWQYGLLQSMVKSWALSDIYFQRPNKSNPGYVVSCARKHEQVLGCMANVRLSDSLVITYQFHREMLPHWKEINDRLISLIQSFIVKGE